MWKKKRFTTNAKKQMREFIWIFKMYVQCMILNKTYGGFFFYKSVANIEHNKFIYKLWQFFFLHKILQKYLNYRLRESTGTDMLPSFFWASGWLINKTSPLPGAIDWSKQHVILTSGTAVWTSELRSRVGILRFQYCTYRK